VSSFIPIEEAQKRLAEIIEQMVPGQQLFITQNDKTIARIVREISPPYQRPEPGSAKGMLTILAEDDEHLEDFKEYMP
jgi:antitoxin (DNA-binding transcriptional repressor) of toxin-antitoxin stability system